MTGLTRDSAVYAETAAKLYKAYKVGAKKDTVQRTGFKGTGKKAGVASLIVNDHGQMQAAEAFVLKVSQGASDKELRAIFHGDTVSTEIRAARSTTRRLRLT